MTRQPTCLHSASNSFLAAHGVGLDLHELCKQAACSKFEAGRGLTGTRGGAYGVVGLSGVKDARRAFPLPTPSRRPARLPAWCICCANGVQVVCTWCASTGQTLDKNWTFTGQRLDIRPGLFDPRCR